MRFLHLSDLHIGLKLMNQDLYEDQEYVLREVVELVRERRPDAVVVAGDLYDKAVPSAEAVKMFDWFLSELAGASPETEIMMISGNHDSAQRVDLYREVLSSRHIHMIGLPPRKPEERIAKVTMQDEYGPVHFYLLPFVKPSMARQAVGKEGEMLSYEETVRRLIEREEVNTGERNVLVSHQFYLPANENAEEVERMDSEIRTVGNVDAISATVLAPFDYAALGHIHKPMKVGSKFLRYSGTPMAYSISEAEQTKEVIEVELGPKGEVKTEEISLEPLREVRKVTDLLANVVAEPSDDYVTVVLTDEVDLDPIEMQERLRAAFPHLLEVRREWRRGVDYSVDIGAEEEKLGTYDLIQSFLGDDLSEEELAIIQDVVNQTEGGTQA